MRTFNQDAGVLRRCGPSVRPSVCGPDCPVFVFVPFSSQRIFLTHPVFTVDSWICSGNMEKLLRGLIFCVFDVDSNRLSLKGTSLQIKVPNNIFTIVNRDFDCLFSGILNVKRRPVL